LEPFFSVSRKLPFLYNINQNSKTKKEETTMATRKPILILFGILLISTWVLGSVIQAGAETMNYKFYTWSIKGDNVPVADAEGHWVGYGVRGSFLVFENGEVAYSEAVIFRDWMKTAGTISQYSTIKFQDGSTITTKTQGTTGVGTAGMTTEIIKGTGRFQGIKGTGASKAKYFPLEKGEAAPKGWGEGTLTYTLPPK
jgi:hypothetical protein